MERAAAPTASTVARIDASTDLKRTVSVGRRNIIPSGHVGESQF
jgi:hypothetical protein